jgi:ABC-type lipoprotein export system ATPase subunit
VNNLLEIRNLTKIYEAEQPVIALNNINLTVKKGDFIAFRGSSGSGKSTLLNLIGTLDTPTKGEIIFDGKKSVLIPPNNWLCFAEIKSVLFSSYFI